MDRLYNKGEAHCERSSILQPQSLSHVRGSSGQHAVEDMVVPLLCRLGAYSGLLQEVVRYMTTYHLVLGAGREGEGE